MKYAHQERPSASKAADTGERNHFEMFGAIGLTRGLPQTWAASTNERGELGKTEFGSANTPSSRPFSGEGVK